MRKVLAGGSAALAVSLVALAPAAQAQDPAPPPAPYKLQPLNLRRDQLGTTAYAGAGRARMKAGDCEGALTSFDAALQTSNQDPSLYRDRGLCHEKLGHPYPAIDDYRTYLTDAPTAPDAEAIRARLAKLEEDTMGRTPTARANDDTDVPSASETATVTVGAEGAKASDATQHDKLQYADHDDDPFYTPVGRGKGFSLAPFFSEHKWFFSGSSFGDSQTWSETVGAQLRWSADAVVALVAEAGYEHFNSSTSADPYVLAGLTSELGLEFRVPLDGDSRNQILLLPGVGYEHIAFSPTDPEAASTSVNAVVPRMRLGYRHLVETDAALDFSIDLGLGKWFVPSEAGSLDIPATVLVAANVGLAWGL